MPLRESLSVFNRPPITTDHHSTSPTSPPFAARRLRHDHRHVHDDDHANKAQERAVDSRHGDQPSLRRSMSLFSKPPSTSTRRRDHRLETSPMASASTSRDQVAPVVSPSRSASASAPPPPHYDNIGDTSHPTSSRSHELEDLDTTSPRTSDNWTAPTSSFKPFRSSSSNTTAADVQAQYDAKLAQLRGTFERERERDRQRYEAQVAREKAHIRHAEEKRWQLEREAARKDAIISSVQRRKQEALERDTRLRQEQMIMARHRQVKEQRRTQRQREEKLEERERKANEQRARIERERLEQACAVERENLTRRQAHSARAQEVAMEHAQHARTLERSVQAREDGGARRAHEEDRRRRRAIEEEARERQARIEESNRRREERERERERVRVEEHRHQLAREREAMEHARAEVDQRRWTTAVATRTRQEHQRVHLEAHRATERVKHARAEERVRNKEAKVLVHDLMRRALHQQSQEFAQRRRADRQMYRKGQ